MDGGFAVGKESRLALCWQADNGFGRTCEPHLRLQSKHKYSSNTPFRAKQNKKDTDLRRMATFFLRKMICVQPLVCEHPDGFGLAYEPYPCKQGGWREVTSIPAKTKQKGHRIGVLLFWLGWMGSNHRNARVKVWCLTAWLHPNIALVFYHILF